MAKQTRMAGFWGLAFLIVLVAGGCGRKHHTASQAEIDRAKQLREERDRREKLEEAKIERVRQQRLEGKKKLQENKREEVLRKQQERQARFRKKRKESTEKEPEEKPRYPARLADWKKADYFGAKAERDSRFVDAVRYLGARSSDKTDAAQLLTDLLGSRVPEGDNIQIAASDVPAARRKSRARGKPADEIRAIVDALAANETDVARQTLQQLLAGMFSTEDDKVARQAALQTLAACPGRKNEAVLFQAMTAADRLQSVEGENLDGERWANDILAAARPNASERFRVMLAEHLANTETPRRRRASWRQFLMEPRTENLAAQVILYQSVETPRKERNLLERYFTVYNSEVLRRLLGIPEEAAGGPGRHGLGREVHEAAANDPDLPVRVARHLWSGPFIAFLRDRLYEVNSLKEQAALIRMAGTIPSDSLRSMLTATLQRNWREGPKGLEAIGLFDAVVGDPGLLVAVKMLPHQESLPVASGTRSRVRPVDRSSTGSTKKIEADWLKASAVLLLASRERFKAAALARKIATNRAGSSPPDRAGLLPITLHENARVIAGFDLHWPDKAAIPGLESGLSPTKLHYVRIQETARLQRIVAYYRRQLNSPEEYNSDRGVWLSKLGGGSEPGTKRAIDVLIGKAREGPPARHNEKEKLTIEVLSVEIRDPSSGNQKSVRLSAATRPRDGE